MVRSIRNRKAESASNAGAFLAIITVIIILYVLFLPPADREALLNENNASFSLGSGANSSSILLQQQIGRVSFVDLNEKTYNVPTVRIYSPTSAQMLKSVPSFTIRNALFDKDNAAYNLGFDVNKDTTSNVALSFNVKSYSGPLQISVNGQQIFNSQITTTNPTPIKLDASYLSDKNTLTFSVPSPGWTFWKSNSYELENVQVTGDVTNFDNSEAKQYFTISEGEKSNLDTVRLYFTPTCTIKDVGPLTITLNNKVIFKGVADCGTRTNFPLDNNLVMQGSNELSFSTTKGSYLIDNINVKVDLKKPTGNTYYFDMKEDYFMTKPETARCGDYDSICPAGCSDIQDPDCCFNHNGIWCANPTDNSNDRCVNYVATKDCGLCKTGYYDSSGDSPTNCQNKCGDNNDGSCLSGCGKYNDKDCCFTASKDNFWCKEVPITGLADKCKASVNYLDCQLCPSGYVNDGGSSPDACSANVEQFSSNPDSQLLDNYQVTFTVRFTDDTSRKRIDFNINGHTVSVDTSNIEFSKVIDNYVLKGTDSIEIEPKEDVDISQILIEIKQVR